VILKKQNATGMNVKGKTMKKRPTTSYQEDLIKDLQDSLEAQAYLNAALLDEDPRIFLLALKNVIEAQDKGISALAKKTKLNRENLYRMLSKKGNPKISSIIPVLNSLGLQLAVQPCKRK
jgi:probable addiction module antidote protein